MSALDKFREWYMEGDHEVEDIFDKVVELTDSLWWTKKVPTVPGVYLRNNPPSSHIVKEAIFEMDGKMCMGGSGVNAVRLEEWSGAKRMWWYGPIQKPPDND